jgi:hypothetical protein
MDDRDVSAGSPFEDFPDATVDKNGHVLYDGVIVGRLIEGDAKKLLGKKVVSFEHPGNKHSCLWAILTGHGV